MDQSLLRMQEVINKLDNWIIRSNHHTFICFSFDILTCPEPGCDYVSEKRDEIERHIRRGHMSQKTKTEPLKLFYCQTCSQNLELKGELEFQEHARACKKSQKLFSDSNEEDEPTKMSTQEPQLDTIKEEKQVEEGGRAFVIDEVPEDLDKLDTIKCDRCEFKVWCKYPSSGYTPSLRQNLRDNMKRHYDGAHNMEYMKFCMRQGCGFRTQSILQMKYHIKSEAGKAQCEVCGKSIKSYNLKSHMKTHSDLHTIDCEHCSRPYGSKEILK